MDSIIQYEYTKPRKEFGQHPMFSNSGVYVESITSNSADAKQWVPAVESTVELDCIPSISIHEVNTERFVAVNKSTAHLDGAWPAEIKTNEFIDRQRYVRRLMNEPQYQSSVTNLVMVAEQAVMQNNTIDLYEEYFYGPQYDYAQLNSSPPSAKTVAVFRDPNVIKRTATKISWHPDGAQKLAVSYSCLQFQQMPADMPLFSYIWDINSPNQPDSKLIPTSPLTSIVYNPRSQDSLVGGQYNGVVGFWDLRKGSTPVDMSLLEHSHHEPVYDMFWVQSRTGNECCSVSTDSQLLWWDTRKLKSGPIDSMRLKGDNDHAYGGTSLEYKSDAGATRYLVGTEEGVIAMCDRKANKDSNSQKNIKPIYGSSGGQHHGPVYSVQRNPFHLKYFLTIGDWSAKIWMEDLKMPLLSTPYDDSYLTAGCWSPTRPGVFFTTKQNGTLDIWDYYYRQDEPTYSTKIGEGSLTSIKLHSNGKYMALGSQDGTVNVLSLSSCLHEHKKDEKAVLAQMFERETKREKNLELRMIQRQREQKDRERGRSKANSMTANSKDTNDLEDDEETRDQLRRAEEDFYIEINQSAIDNAAPASSCENDFDKDSLEKKEQPVE